MMLNLYVKCILCEILLCDSLLGKVSLRWRMFQLMWLNSASVSNSPLANTPLITHAHWLSSHHNLLPEDKTAVVFRRSFFSSKDLFLKNFSFSHMCNMYGLWPDKFRAVVFFHCKRNICSVSLPDDRVWSLISSAPQCVGGSDQRGLISRSYRRRSAGQKPPVDRNAVIPYHWCLT